MNRTAKIIIGILAVLVVALVGFIVWAAVTPAPPTQSSTESDRYPGVQAGTIEVGYLDTLTANGVRVMDDPAAHAVHGRNTCRHLEVGDQSAALDYLRDQTTYSQQDRLIVYQAVEYGLCAVN